MLLRISYSPCGADCPFGAMYYVCLCVCMRVCVCAGLHVYVCNALTEIVRMKSTFLNYTFTLLFQQLQPLRN